MSHKDQDTEGNGRNVGKDDQPGPDSATRLPRDEADTEGHKHWASFPWGPYASVMCTAGCGMDVDASDDEAASDPPRVSGRMTPARIIAPPRHRTGSSRSPNGRDAPTIVHSRSTADRDASAVPARAAPA